MLPPAAVEMLLDSDRWKKKRGPPRPYLGRGPVQCVFRRGSLQRWREPPILISLIIAKITSARKDFTGFFILNVSEIFHCTGGICERMETMTETIWDEKKTTTRCGAFQEKTEKFVEKSKKGVDRKKSQGL